MAPVVLPYYLKPIPPRIGHDEISYLRKKGALSIPDTSLRNELLRSYIEYCHPFMPLLDLHDFLRAISSPDGSAGKVSLFTFSAVMFVATAYVPFRHLQNAGYQTRKEARKDFFQKARLLYDFDYEIDRISLVQGLLLLTYYYETPDDSKDTWHYMGLAISLAHTIGLHRNPERSSMDAKRKKLWRRIWWSLYMRDRLIALGMRRPTRIKSEDFDVPALTIDDFELAALPDQVTCISSACVLARDVEKQRQLAIICIEKTKLCLCISQILSTQYSVLNNNQGILSDDGNTRTTMMLLPKKLDSQANEIQMCDEELQKWYKQLPPEAHYKHATVEDTNNANKPIIVNRAMLHLVHFCALSALHRPQVLPSAPSHTTGADLLEVSRRKVRWAANEITDIAQNLCTLDLVKYLPTTGVTVLLPAIIIHLLDIKAPDEETRRSSLRGFCQCMQVMSKLRDNYAAADYSCAFLEAAIRKAEIIVPQRLNNTQSSVPKKATLLSGQGLTNKLSNFKVDNLVAAGHDMHLVNSPIPPITHTLTPPPDPNASFDANQAATQPVHMSDADVAARLNSFLASTPPDSNSPDHIPDSSSFQSFETDTLNSGSNIDPVLTNPELAAFSSTKFADTALFPPTDFEQDFDSLLNTDLMLRDGQAGGGWGFGEDGGAALAMQGESSGFTFDMDFVKGMGGEMGEGQGNMAAQKNGKDTVDGVFEENSEGAQGEGGENVASEDNAKDQAVEQSSEPVPADNAVARRTLDVDGTGDNVATSAPLAVEAAA
ncbi:MAG: hypothetical protein M1820_000593 [Bogoriella megaspora]|nr:MAG: hypothetical protein M1820_000593 [Bogoriella megaspora]